MNALLKPIQAADRRSQTLSADLALQEARQRGVQRTLQALFREQLLHKEHLICEGAIAWLPLWSQQGMLRIEGLQIGRIGDCQLSGTVAYYRTGARPQALATASALLACIAPSLPGPVRQDDLQRMIRELDNSTDNDMLCQNYRRIWGRQLVRELAAERGGFVAGVRASGIAQPSLLLEQWGTIGHPWHPTFKSRLGLSPDEVIALSPEFHPTLTLPLAAIRADKAQVALARHISDYRNWFASTFPQAWQQWLAALDQGQQDTAAWLPLPLHPYQAQYIIPHKFAAEIAAGDLLLLPAVGMNASPSMSFRTVAVEGAATLPHIKLPVALQMTSAQRTVSPRSVVMGPRVTALLETMLDHEGNFDGTLDILAEHVGLYYRDAGGDDERARHLSVLYRANPASRQQDGLFAVPVGSLFADSPLDGRPIATELAGLAFGDHQQGALAFFERHAQTVLKATLGAYLLYGVALEAHQQNSFILVDEQYRPVRLLVRDFGDLRIHAGTLRDAGLHLELYRDQSHPLYEDDLAARGVLLHSVLICHLAELALLLARSYRQPEEVFWTALRREVELAFDRLRARTAPQRWKAERSAILEQDWPIKSLLGMRLCDSQDDLRGSVPNPLRGLAAP